MPKQPVLVIGAGAAGLMAAGQAAAQGADVTVLERGGRAGAKLSITGKGRCNLTNNCTTEEFLAHVPTNARFLHSALSRFSPADAMEFFEALGVPLKTERGRRVFPQSDSARDVTGCLAARLKGLGAAVRYNTRTARLALRDGAVCGVYAGKESIPARAVVIATGGLSYPKTGSSGDGYKLAGQSGHTVTALSPSLVPLVSPDGHCREMQGLSLRNVSLRLLGASGKALYTGGPGELLFTHFGLSGPLALSASACWRDGASAEIDLKPGLDEKQLQARALRDFEQYAARNLANALGGLLHKTMIPVIISLSGIPADKKACEITREERRRLLGLVKAFPVRLSGPRPIEEAVITRGGVDCREVSPKTMGSKLCRGLFFAGEVLDLDACTGGYNLQIAWSTGHAAGCAAADFARA